MIKQHTCFSANCDECNNAPETDEGAIAHFDTATQAENDAEACGWAKLPNGRLICEDCLPTLVERGEIERDGDFGYRLVATVEVGEQQ